MRCFEFHRAYARIFVGIPDAGDQSRGLPLGYRPAVFDDLNIGVLKRFVQCDIYMEDMRIAQRACTLSIDVSQAPARAFSL